jgi:hypothetical protein
MELVVGRILRAHGIKGEAVVGFGPTIRWSLCCGHGLRHRSTSAAR